MLFVDPRIGSQHLAAHFDELRLPYELTPLDYGDVMFLGNGPEGPESVGIELKNILDFINSMHSGRLAGHQLPGLQEKYQHVWVIIEGFYRSRKGSGIAEIPRGPAWVPLYLGRRPVFWHDIESFITSLEVQCGVHVRRTRTPHETARLIGDVIYGWWERPWEQHKSLRQLDKPQVGRLSIRIESDPVKRFMHNVAAALPGIGYERAVRAVNSGVFSCGEDLATADVEQWAAALGLKEGRTQAIDIHRMWRERITTPNLRARDGAAQRRLHPAARRAK